MSSAVIQLPSKILNVLGPARGSVLYRVLHGGRGSAKSRSAATVASVWGHVEPLRILCCREYQTSIKESFHAELKEAISGSENGEIRLPWLDAGYDVGTDYLRHKSTGTEFLFRGLRTNTNSIKSLANIDLTIVEEAEDISETSWLALEATVFRKPRSELWAIYNPSLDGSPVDLRFRKSPPKRMLIAEVNHSDNPFFPPELEELRKREQERLDPNTYAHVWEGAYLVNSDLQVFANKYRTAEFTPDPATWDGPYQGGDFGFSQDPLAAVRCWIHNDNLYVEYEAGKTALELDDTSSYVTARIPEFDRYRTRWDNARPESISHLKRHGLPLSLATEKWSGSVEDGIAYMRSFKEIILHPRCTQTAKEMRLYSYKKDRQSGDILPIIVDAWNHYIDAIRYALDPMIRRTRAQAMVFMTSRNR